MAHVDVRILDRDFRLAVSEDGRERLLQAVSMVDEKMRAIRDAGKISGVDRIAVMAALQLAHELLTAAHASSPPGEVVSRIRKVSEDLEAEIKRQENLF